MDELLTDNPYLRADGTASNAEPPQSKVEIYEKIAKSVLQLMPAAKEVSDAFLGLEGMELQAVPDIQYASGDLQQWSKDLDEEKRRKESLKKYVLYFLEFNIPG